MISIEWNLFGLLLYEQLQLLLPGPLFHVWLSYTLRRHSWKEKPVVVKHQPWKHNIKATEKYVCHSKKLKKNDWWSGLVLSAVIFSAIAIVLS